MGALVGLQNAAQAAGLFGSGSNTPLISGVGSAATIFGTAAVGFASLSAALPSLGALASGSLAEFAALAGPIGITVGIVLTILSRVFHGADPNQVPAAQIEQVFEAAADNVYALQKAGYLVFAESSAGMQKLISAGNLYYQQAVQSNPQYAQDRRPFVNGQANMTKVINAEIQAASLLPPAGLLPFDQTAAHALYVQDGAGWYSASVDAAVGLTDGFMLALRQANPVNPPAPPPTPPPQAVAAPVALPAPAPVAATVSATAIPTVVFPTAAQAASTVISPAPVASGASAPGVSSVVAAVPTTSGQSNFLILAGLAVLGLAAIFFLGRA